ncbi:acyl-CoA thioesterase [Marivirga sp. S37H4]|uniref:Acyl-CoA thioesterase n=1 Tax=Marivirga aurantiaca TaxID=2802615 RepID=A0A934WYS5_9BACT|nr:acyl-CoA thioesterase [Marivirga aurantiaca]MBK6265305.1 acyl-CoA thioesterase [Marivirga aurantiaca]
MKNNLKVSLDVPIRFSEVDSLSIVWHGNYLKYFEDVREEFGRKFGFDYLSVRDLGYVMPIITVDLKYKKAIRYGDLLTVNIFYKYSKAAKLCFDYTIQNQEQELMCTGYSEQVFLDLNDKLQIIDPPFFKAWKENQNV